MLRKAVVATFLVLCATSAICAGKLKVEKPDQRVMGKYPKAKVEVYAMDAEGGLKRVLKMEDKELKQTVKLAPGLYVVYVEDQATGHIMRFDGEGKGLDLGAEDVTIGLDAFYEKVAEIERKDKSEKRAKAEVEPKKKHKSTLALGGPPVPDTPPTRDVRITLPESPSGNSTAAPAMAPLMPKEPDTEYSPPTGEEGTAVDGEDAVDEVMVRYGPEAGLHDRYTFVSEISAEARNKLNPLEIYRLKLPASITAAGVVQGYADDPRLSWVEPNLTLSIPDPVEGESAREKPQP